MYLSFIESCNISPDYFSLSFSYTNHESCTTNFDCRWYAVSIINVASNKLPHKLYPYHIHIMSSSNVLKDDL